MAASRVFLHDSGLPTGVSITGVCGSFPRVSAADRVSRPFREALSIVLTIGKLGTSRGRLEYYDAQVAAGVEDYYAGRGESPGRWRGAGARALGLRARGTVKRSEFMALMQGRHPIDGSVLRVMGARSTVAGFDLTFSAPKSVSVLFAIGDEHTSAELLAAHEQAVDVALSYLEREACRTRRGRDGIERVSGDGFVAASYRHRMSRAGDPQLHSHVVVANMTCADDRYTALDGKALYEHKSAGGAVYRAVLRAEVRRRLPWTSWHRVGRGLFELDGVPETVLRHFSQRRVEIEERALELAGTGAAALSRERMQGIALATRRAKTYGVEQGSWREDARARAAEHGLGDRELAALAAHSPQLSRSANLERESARLSGTGGLTERHNTFTRRHALAELAGAFPDGASIDELEAATDGYLDHESVISLDPRGEPRYTTAGLIALERELLDSAERRATELAGTISARAVDHALAAYVPALNGEQAAAVRAIATSGRGVEAVTALAGTGKTTMLGALAAAYRQDGWQVLGTAPTARAARELRERAGIEADTIHALLLRVRLGPGLDSRTLLVIDEAGMAATRCSAALLAHAELAGAKVVTIGDPGQLTAVEAGGWLAAIARAQSGPALREVMRQQDPAEREALEQLHDGDPTPYLAHKQDEITVHETELGALLEVRDSWLTAQHRHGRRAAVMIARDNLTRERLNRAARAALKHAGVLDDHGVIIGGREYSPGDRVVARRNDRRNDLDNGSLATVVGTDPRRRSIVVQTNTGQQRTLPHDYVAAHLEHAYALTAHAAQGATVTWAAVVGRTQDFSREWAYTALSRATETAVLHLISEPPEREREEYAPAEPLPERQQTMSELARAMRQSESEPLAAEQTASRTGARGEREPIALTGLQGLRRHTTSNPTLRV
jgi:conjugative relaxase-like TrwC/TraI family protein